MSGRECERSGRAGGRRERTERDWPTARAGDPAGGHPRWFWWASAVLAIELAADMEFQRGALFWAGIALFTAGTLAVNVLKSRALRSAPPHRDLIAPGSDARMMAGAAALVAAVTGVGLATRLSLEAAGAPYPGMIASAVAMAVFVAGGQMLVRYHTAFLVRRSGGRG